MQECLIIHNPYSGKKVSNNFSARIKEKLGQYGYRSHYVETDHIGHTTELVAADKESNLLLIAGGDGTFSEGIQGALSNQGATLAYLPKGTTNDVGKMHGYSGTLESKLDQLMEGTVRDVDCFEVDGHPVSYVVGGGHIMNIVYEVTGDEKRKYGYFAYLGKGIAEMLRKPPCYDISYTVDGKTHDAKCSLLLVSNSTSIAGFPIYSGDKVKLNDGNLKC